MGSDREGEGKTNWDHEATERLLDAVDKSHYYDLKVRLNSGAGDWRLVDAECAFMDLQDMQKDRPEEFAALVALVQPRGATRSAAAVLPQVLAKLKEAKTVLPDGSVERLVAAVLDAAYKETPNEGVILSNPILYPSREVFEHRERMIGEDSEFGGRVLDERMKNRDESGGPSR